MHEGDKMRNMDISFWKMHGAGNDFVLLDDRALQFPDPPGACVRWLTNRRRGVGADGVILIQPSSQADFRMRFYNSDGGEADMCGNGARCVARLAYELGLAGVDMTIQTAAGIIRAEYLSPLVRLYMTPPRGERLDLSIVWKNKKYAVHTVDTGVPHAVLFVDDVTTLDVSAFGAFVRHHPLFSPAGVNVNFVQKMGPETLRIRTFERGVEGETMACGTGITAAAWVGHRLRLLRLPAKVITVGNDVLAVQDNPLTLTGPAEHVFRGTFDYRMENEA